jgi:tRNA(Glu) U13 pseudouridine synthase TruD
VKSADHFRDLHELFLKVDRRQRKMYVHPYQSYLWNELVSERWEIGGNVIVAGDVMQVLQTQEIVSVTADNVGMYSIFEARIPLPSHDAARKRSP